MSSCKQSEESVSRSRMDHLHQVLLTGQLRKENWELTARLSNVRPVVPLKTVLVWRYRQYFDWNGLKCVLLKDADVLTPRVPECDFIWKLSLQMIKLRWSH